MADIRINSLPSTATSFNTDDYIAIDGASAGTRRMLAANPPFSDVTLGTSGPSVKSTLSARAPRQGLVFDSSHGTTYATVANIPAFGQGVAGSTRGDFTFAAWVREESSFAGTPIVVIGNAAGGFYCEFNSSGIPYVGVQGGSTLYSTTACVVGRTYLLTYTRTGNTGTWYIDGVATNSLTDGINYTLPFANVSFASPYGLHGFCYPLAYNRCLSATEVKALYEAGAPAGADYNSASNTSINTSAWTNNSGLTSFSSADATQWTGTASSGAYFYVSSNPQFATTKGARYRVTFTWAGGAPGLFRLGVIDAGSSLTSASQQTAPVNGSNTYEVSSEVTASNGKLFFGFSQNGLTPVVTNITVTRIGLLLAPDAAQAGGGLTWYDTSGNAANITLPASGVSWNVPTSGNVTSGSALTLRAGGTNQNVNLAPVGLGIVNIIGGTGTQTAAINKSGGANFYFSVVSSADESLRFQNSSGTNLVEFNKGGNVLIGTTTDGGQKLQVSGTGYFADVVEISKSAANTNLNALTLKNSAYNVGESSSLLFAHGGAPTSRISSYLPGSNKTELVFYTSNSTPTLTEALRIDGSQNATFAGKITANGAGSTFRGTATNDSAAAGYVGELISATDNTGVSLTTGTRTDVVSISLTAGDWDVTGYVGYLPSGGASSTYQEGSISATSATIGAAGARTLLKMTTTAQVEFPIPTVRVSLSGTTTYYLVTNNDFTGGTMKGTGIIRARRVR